MHIFRLCKKHLRSFKKIGIKLLDELRRQGRADTRKDVQKAKYFLRKGGGSFKTSGLRAASAYPQLVDGGTHVSVGSQP